MVKDNARALYRPPQGERVVLNLPKEELEAVDGWGVPAGMPSRTATIRELLKRGLEAVAHERASPK